MTLSCKTMWPVARTTSSWTCYILALRSAAIPNIANPAIQSDLAGNQTSTPNTAFPAFQAAKGHKLCIPRFCKAHLTGMGHLVMLASQFSGCSACVLTFLARLKPQSWVERFEQNQANSKMSWSYWRNLAFQRSRGLAWVAARCQDRDHIDHRHNCRAFRGIRKLATTWKVPLHQDLCWQRTSRQKHLGCMFLVILTSLYTHRLMLRIFVLTSPAEAKVLAQSVDGSWDLSS